MLVRLFSETDLLLKPFKFEAGINIILGKYSEDKDKRGINGIGKSSLVRLINYALLSDTAEKIFSQEKYNFLRTEKHNIVLELKIESKTLFIKRYFVTADKVYFGNTLNELEEYTKTELKKILINKLFPIQSNDVFFEGNKFGTLMSFFIKDDLENQKRADPLYFLTYNNANARDIAIYNFFLLNLPTKNLIGYNELAKEYANHNKAIKVLQDKIEADTGKPLEEFRSERIKIEQSISLLEKSLKDFKFLDNYKNVESQLIEITSQINEKLKDFHSLNQKLKKVKDAFQYTPDIDTNHLRKLYNEVVSTFGDIVSKTLDEIIAFKKEILENRNKFLVSRENQLQKAINQVSDEISKIEKKRSELYKKLEEKGALSGITNTYEQLTIEKTKLAGNLGILKQIDEIQEILGNLNVKISEIKRDILYELKNNQKSINDLRGIFQEILENAIFLDNDNLKGYFDISSRNNSKRDQLPFKIYVEIPKADALGQSRLKIVAYDLMVFLNNIKASRKFPDFIVHDGVYHGISLNTKIKALNYIYHQYLANPNFQYIVTFNEDEIYIPKEKQLSVGKFDFDINEQIIAEFTDSPSKMIFKRDFK
ncbi:MAG: DUF2326 domain-containing protein [Candidatus Altiarchaeales archaeon HGW-Altiarchaeales-1]|nr:MAG: DUF2326 domain-containing protein [Candidatus Altiarchaeales archaeon HGW-Altiarchaeales-1]